MNNSLPDTMTLKTTILTVAMCICNLIADAQQYVGINTTNPERPLEIEGSLAQYLRLHSTSFFGNEAGIELLRGDENANHRDWKLTNDAGLLKFITGTDNFATAGSEAMRISTNGFVGIGTTSPVTRLHVEGGDQISNTDDGYMMLGSKTSANLVFSNSGLMARNNSTPASLYIQAEGGSTHIAHSVEGNIYMGLDGGKVGIGGTFGSGRLNIEADEFHILLRNENTTVNNWYIGASDAGWIAGDNQLIFSPTSGSSDGILRLMDVTENDGINAPVMIYSGADQALLFDGNEIDSKFGALYFNHNSDHDTYINPFGGKVGVGLTNPSGRLHINTDALGLGLQQGDYVWYISPSIGGDLIFTNNNVIVALLEYNTGNWVPLSDQRMKQNITRLGPIMDKINRLPIYSYAFIDDPSSQRDIGVIAQEVEPIFPEVVSKSENQYGVAYDELAVLAIKGVQEQQAQLDALMAQVDALIAKK